MNSGTNELEIASQTDIGSITGDCDPPNFYNPSSPTGAFPTVPAVAGDVFADGDSNAAPISTRPLSSPFGLLWISLATLLAYLFAHRIDL